MLDEVDVVSCRMSPGPGAGFQARGVRVSPQTPGHRREDMISRTRNDARVWQSDVSVNYISNKNQLI